MTRYLATPKKCGTCGKVHRTVGPKALNEGCLVFGGYWWNCACESTLYAHRMDVAWGLKRADVKKLFTPILKSIERKQ